MMTDVAQVIRHAVVEVTQYRACCVPMEYPEWYHWAVYVDWKAPDQWAVAHSLFEFSKSAIGKKNPEGMYRPTNKQPYRFDLHTALDLAVKLAPKVTINGRRAADYMAWYDERTKDRA